MSDDYSALPITTQVLLKPNIITPLSHSHYATPTGPRPLNPLNRPPPSTPGTKTPQGTLPHNPPRFPTKIFNNNRSNNMSIFNF